MQIDNKLQQKLKYQTPQFQLCKIHDHQNNELRYIGKNQDQIFNLQCESCILENKEMQNLNLEQIFEQIQESNQKIFAQSYTEFENIDNLIGKLGNNLIQVAETLTNLKTQFKKKWKAQLNHLIEQTNKTLKSKMNSIIQFQKSEKEDDYLQSHKLQQHLKNLNSVLIKEQNKYVMKTDEIKDYIKKQKEEIYKLELNQIQAKIKSINDIIQQEIEENLNLKKGTIEQQTKQNDKISKEEQKEGYEETYSKKNQYFQPYKNTQNSITSEKTNKNSQNLNNHLDHKIASENQLNILNGTQNIKRRQNQQYSESDLDTNKSDIDEEEEEDQEIVSEHDSHSSPINFKEQSDTNNNNTYSHKSIKVTKKIKKQKNDLDKMLKKEQQQQHHKQKQKMSINSITYSEYSSSQKYNTDNKGNKDFGKTCSAENCQNKENYDDKVLFCQGCKMGFHSKCLNLNFWLAQVNSSQSPWKCKKCKECEVCHKKIKATSQLEFQNCKLCDRPYHVQCMTKKEKSQLQKEGEFWCCGQCRKCPNCLECKNCKENKECNNKKTKCNNVIWVDMDEEKCEQARQKKRNCDKCWERHKKIYNQDNSYDFCFLCMKIHKRGSSKSCKCHGCEAWVHTRCDPNAEEYFRQHKNLKHQVYYCPQCNIIFNQTGKKREIQQVQIDYDSDSQNQG